MKSKEATYQESIWIWFLSAIVLFISFFQWGCSKADQDPIHPGKKLSDVYCGSCHLPVSPDMLDRQTWLEGVLPAMAPKLGVEIWRGDKYYPAGGPNSIPFSDWIQIVDYFEKEAPEVLEPARPEQRPTMNRNLFEILTPDIAQDLVPTAATTMVRIDPQGGQLFTSDANENQLMLWNSELQPTAMLSMQSPAVALSFDPPKEGKRDAVLTTIGTMLAEDISRGIVQEIELGNDGASTQGVIGSELTRPLRALPGDFNQDGRRDWIIFEFGHETGGLYLHQQKEEEGSYERKLIFGMPGAEDGVVDDFNGDGWPDLMVLFAYGDEGIWLFTNNRQGGFTPENILRFSPVYGSTSMELVDMNDDGRKDIVLTNGDNADFSPVLKPYHGLRIFLNEGDQYYEESYFFPINGATKVMVEDFDNDGDRDMAVIAFFADLQEYPQESFTYFEQVAPMEFIPQHIPVHTYGRWLAMDAGDFDGDGDVDLVLGNFSRDFISEMDFNPTWNTELPFILLKNTNLE